MRHDPDHHDARYEDGEPLPETDWDFVPYDGLDPVPVDDPEPTAAKVAYARWTQHGGKRHGLAPTASGPAWEAFRRGWDDSLAGRGDFARRGYFDAERAAYMIGRFLASAARERSAA